MRQNKNDLSRIDAQKKYLGGYLADRYPSNAMVSKNFSYFLSLLAFCTVAICSCEGKDNATRDDNIVNDTLKKTEYKNPVFEPVLADPSVIRDPDTKLFYAYGTEDNWADGGGSRLVPILQSANLTRWKVAGNAFRTKPGWKQQGGIWAPDINFINGKYFMYYSFSTWGDKNPGIGLATADTPTGPFIDQGKILDSYDMDVPNSIDPFYISDNSHNYLFWGSYSNEFTQGIHAIELSEDSRTIKEGAAKVKIAAGDFEAVMIHKRQGYYYFFGSKGSCCEGVSSNYHVMIARSENLTGPYLDKNGNKITDRGNGSPLLKGNDKYVGTGHNSNIITDKDGQDWMLYHAIDKNQGKLPNGTSRRVLMLDRINWIAGWPEISNGTPSTKINAAPHF